MTIIDQKVREKLRNVIWDEITGGQREGCQGTADCITRAILQSPELRVTLVEPRFHIEIGTDRLWVFDGQYSLAGFNRSAHRWAKEYCDWLNSKEPKS